MCTSLVKSLRQNVFPLILPKTAICNLSLFQPLLLQGCAVDQRALQKSQSLMNIFTYIKLVHHLFTVLHLLVRFQNGIYAFGCLFRRKFPGDTFEHFTFCLDSDSDLYYF